MEKKKILLIMSVGLMLAACGNTKWEYKIVKKEGAESPLYNIDIEPQIFEDPTETLNKMGQEGWELVSTYTEIKTTYPNFGDKKYVTGIRENTKTSVLNFVFKRPRANKTNKKK